MIHPMSNSSPRSPTPRRAGRPLTDPKTLVREGYNRLSSIYRPPLASADCFAHQEADYARWLRPIFDGLDPGANVLDLGCGTGIPVARLLSSRIRVTGVDLSDVMIRRARRGVPGVRFIRADMAEVEFPAGSFDGIVSFYTMIHLPVEEQPPLLRRIHSWLHPGGVLLAVSGHGAYEGVDKNWLDSGVPMYWSHADPRTFRRWLREAGFLVKRRDFIPGGKAGHDLFWAVATEGY